MTTLAGHYSSSYKMEYPAEFLGFGGKHRSFRSRSLLQLKLRTAYFLMIHGSRLTGHSIVPRKKFSPASALPGTSLVKANLYYGLVTAYSTAGRICSRKLVQLPPTAR